MRITKKQLAGLDQYKYSGIDKSVVSKHVLGPFWTWLVTLFPLSLAPNTITFLGLCFVFANVFTLLWFDPTYEGKVLPSWVYLSWAIGLFAYQSMDAIDGKQARRTGMASALGEMFDHGCDAINTTLEVVLCAHALGLNRSWWTVASQAATLCNFYASTWEEYHTGTLFLSAFSGPVEGILLICVIYLITAFHPSGPGFWSTPILTPLFKAFPSSLDLIVRLDKVLGLTDYWRLERIPVNVAFMMFGALGTVGNIVTSYSNVIVARRKAGKPILSPLLGYLPFFTHVLILVVWLHAELRGGVSLVHDGRLLPFIGYWGMAFSYQVSQLILAHVTKSPFPFWNGMMVYSLFGAVDANTLWWFGREPLVQNSPVAANVFIGMSFFVALFNYIRFAREVIWQITEHTGIACFTVRHKDSTGKWVENDLGPKKDQ
ncbi:uncharacterized protein IL334_002181 [Kwoniella shivajii]|uniref:Ethanolaminephosphotransferase n=1 Tax=Kwoniella shivajii TaxID=564305 RepID=A0ABZ1CU58_9TREE|nr:hypothetical protein IL334_002181 [Kwoniella shivajii]